MYLVDTNILSAASPTKTGQTPGLIDWMDRNSKGLFLSVITIAEVGTGIAKARRTGATGKAGRLAEWLDTVIHLYGGRILPIDVAVARALGDLSDHASSIGEAPGLADLAIAATAQSRGYTILTRNLRHFRGPGTRALDPYASLPADIA